MNLDEKDTIRLRALRDATARAGVELNSAVVAHEAAEKQAHEANLLKRQCVAKYTAANQALRQGLREIALKAGVDPDKPYAIDPDKGTIGSDNP